MSDSQTAAVALITLGCVVSGLVGYAVGYVLGRFTERDANRLSALEEQPVAEPVRPGE